MSDLLSALHRHARRTPDHVAIEGPGGALRYAELISAIEQFATLLRVRGARCIGLYADNSPAWAVLDLAAVAARILCVPLPAFHTGDQTARILDHAGVDVILSDRPERFPAFAGGESLRIGGRRIMWLARDADAAIPDGVAKLTYTSGTTGEPKGVMLSQATIESVARSLVSVARLGTADRHLALLPYAVLLENVAGLYAPLFAGATVVAAGLREVGMHGATEIDGARLVTALRRHRASTAITAPQSLKALVAARAAGAPRPSRLRFVAVGGAPLAAALIDQAEALGVPLHEGYGLSECASVVTLNGVAGNRPGSVGRALPHAGVRIADDGEIEVRGSLCHGYLHEARPATARGWWATGDLGHLDDDGYLYLDGRRKNLFVTAFGRNVAPEWIEGELTRHPAIVQAAVFGEARPWNLAVLLPAAGHGPEALPAAVAAANRRLPDYARIRAWLAVDTPFSPANGLLTGTGRPRRGAIYAAYRGAIELRYQDCQETNQA